MPDNPLISIIVPVYNVEDYLTECLDSLVNQTYKNIEIICVNDESPDDSYVILDKYAKLDKRIKIINQKNQGLSGARNTGMKNASGDYVMFVDSDDWIDLNTCESAVNAALKNSADLVMWSYTRESGERSLEKLMFWDDNTVFEADRVKNTINRRLCGLLGEELSRPDYANAIETAWGKLYRFSLIKDNNVEFISERTIGTEDALFNIYATKYVNRAVYLKKSFNHYRKNNNTSLTSNYKSKLFKQWQCLFDHIQAYIDENNLGDSFRQSLSNRIALSLVGLGLNVMQADCGGKQKRKMLKDIITYDRNKKAYRALQFGFLPIHWKVFFWGAKHGLSFIVYMLLIVMKKIIN